MILLLLRIIIKILYEESQNHIDKTASSGCVVKGYIFPETEGCIVEINDYVIMH